MSNTNSKKNRRPGKPTPGGKGARRRKRAEKRRLNKEADKAVAADNKQRAIDKQRARDLRDRILSQIPDDARFEGEGHDVYDPAARHMVDTADLTILGGPATFDYAVTVFATHTKLGLRVQGGGDNGDLAVADAVEKLALWAFAVRAERETNGHPGFASMEAFEAWKAEQEQQASPSPDSDDETLTS